MASSGGSTWARLRIGVFRSMLVSLVQAADFLPDVAFVDRHAGQQRRHLDADRSADEGALVVPLRL